MAENEVSGSSAAPGSTPLSQDKPKTTPRTARSNGAQNNLTSLRAEIAAHMEGEFLVTDVANFVTSYMPFEPTDEDVNNFVDSTSVKEAAIMTEDWFADFEDKSVPEKQYFKPLEEIAAHIDNIKQVNGPNGRTRNKFNFRLCPDSRIAADIAGSNNMIDACITSDNISDRLTTSGIAVVFEFKMKTANEIENNIQVVSANVQIMNDDARRMFTYGVTIVEDEVTLWYHSRSHSAVSESFNFVQKPKLFIKVLMSFLFAKEEELGYDPMVIREPNGTYIFKMPVDGKTRFFRTETSLSEYRSCNITGRMARVWEVGEYSSTKGIGKPKARFVLKDVWLDASANTEKAIQERIFEDIEKFIQPSQVTDPMSMFDEATFETLKALIQNEGYKSYFLRIDADWVGQMSKKAALGSKRKAGLLLPVRAFGGTKLKAVTGSSSRTSYGPPRPTAMETDHGVIIPRDFAPKKQYRVIFAEICKTVGELETLGEVVDVLQEMLVALQLMYCAGWVHRDISCGNILAHRPKKTDKWKAKLSDLEYARRYPPSSDYNGAADPKTGTPYFMPHEILSLRTLYDEELATLLSQSQETQEEIDFFAPENDAPDAPEQFIIYNFQHDLESVWWILIWTLTARVPHQLSSDFASKIFQNRVLLTPERADCMTKSITKSLKACLEPSLQHFALPLERVRLAMRKAYVVRAQDKQLFVRESYRDILAIFVRFFSGFGLATFNWRAMSLDTKKPQTSAPALQSSSQHVGTLPLVVNAPGVPQPGRNKRTRMRDDADYEPSDSKESETQSDQDHSEDKKKGKGKKKDTMSRKKPRTADKETGAQ